VRLHINKRGGTNVRILFYKAQRNLILRREAITQVIERAAELGRSLAEVDSFRSIVLYAMRPTRWNKAHIQGAIGHIQQAIGRTLYTDLVGAYRARPS
jgi:hypothetical protein